MKILKRFQPKNVTYPTSVASFYSASRFREYGNFIPTNYIKLRVISFNMENSIV